MYPDIQLSDGIILLRPPMEEDASAIYDAVIESLSELHPWLDWATPAYDKSATLRLLEHFQQAWENSTAFQFVITGLPDGEYLGSCGIDGIDHKNETCNLGYWVRTGRAGKGIASRAVRLAARFAFQSLKLKRAEILAAAGNIASQRTAQKAGAHFEQLMKGHLVVRENLHDALLYSFTPADFKE